jgi:hypothetical protein
MTMAAPKKTEPAKKPQGRPSTYTEELAAEICARLSKGEPLAQICRDEHMPAVRTVSDWKTAHETFSADFGRARDDGYDVIAAECLDIADETSNDTLYTEHGDRPNTEWISRSKLRIETRLKLLAKWDPRRYGEKLAIGGASDLPPIDNKTTLDVTGLSTQALAEIMAARDAAK